MQAEHWPAKQVICVETPVFLCQSYFVVFLQVKVKRRRLEWCTAELRALLTRVYHRTWTGGRWMFENMGNAWVRRLKACVAAKGVFFE